MKRLSIILILILTISIAFAQTVQVVFHPSNPYFFSINDAWNYSILNLGNKPVGSTLEVYIYRGGSFLIYHSQTSPLTLAPGENSGQIMISKIITTDYSGDEIANYFKNTGMLPAGNYSLCIWVKSSQGNIVANSCQELNITTITLPILTYPYDEEVINTPLPQLTWIPVMPQGIPQLEYLLEIWETGSNNRIAKENIASLKTADNNFQYNVELKPLVEGKQYLWQVSAFAGSFYLGKSQTWEFSIGDTSDDFSGSHNPERADSTSYDSDYVVEDTDSYRVIADQTYGADYLALGTLKIAFNNVAFDSTLNYTISPIDQPEQYLTGLPAKTIRAGLNKINIDLASTGLFVNQKNYNLEISDGNGKTYYLNFLYLAP